MSNHPVENTFPEPRQIGRCNWVGLFTLVEKEVGRFMNVYMQTLIAPVVTLVLFFAVFTLSFKQHIAEGIGISGMQFLAPGLLMMTMIQNAFSNPSSSLIIAKVQGNIVDILMPPLAPWEVLSGLMIGALLRCLVIGVLGYGAISLFVTIPVHSLSTVLIFGVLGNVLLATIGVIAGLWADKFDHMATVTNFIITPLTFLSGTFYALSALPETWQKIALFNPFFYMIDGFRAGFIGHAETPLWTGFFVLLGLCTVLMGAAWWMLRTGYKTKY
ncbi:MAG TPA: ABC transporter permease [Alphaproteobacteria bacterium]|nr:ABC transporter permease [Alphaproteobacteria bacterium]HRK97790.1 ABC transporter permease [Alphaproteobacteria bacterium]